MHLHAVPWIDYPFVIRRYFGDEGLFGTGAAILFKGSGFYETDYRSESYKNAAKKEQE